MANIYKTKPSSYNFQFRNNVVIVDLYDGLWEFSGNQVQWEFSGDVNYIIKMKLGPNPYIELACKKLDINYKYGNISISMLDVKNNTLTINFTLNLNHYTMEVSYPLFSKSYIEKLTYYDMARVLLSLVSSEYSSIISTPNIDLVPKSLLSWYGVIVGDILLKLDDVLLRDIYNRYHNALNLIMKYHLLDSPKYESLFNIVNFYDTPQMLR